jgi:lysophospholipase L1-like esterase
MKKSYFIIAAMAAITITSCKSKIEPDVPSAGEANFTKYVAIGNSLTAGFADGSLYKSGQESSYPNMLAGQFQLVGGGAFKQPLLNDNAGWPTLKRVLGIKANCATGVPGLSPVLFSGTPDASNANNISAAGPYNNLGVPGIRCIDYGFPGYGALNPYSARFFTDAQKAGTPVAVALGSQATFFTCWLGNNDVLGYATGGGEGAVSGIIPGDISPVATFKAVYDALIDGMTTNGAKGALMTIPDVSATPFFTTIPAKGLPLTRQGQVDSLNAAYAPVGITFTLGANFFVIADAAAPGGLRQAKAGEYILLTASDSITCGGWGSKKPIPEAYTLTADEVTNVVNATNAFNQIITDNAVEHGLALVDMNAYMKSLVAGITWNGVSYTTTFVTGGAFSLDGIHLTPRGYALAANEILRVINQHYKASIPAVDINKYNGILFP